jgi:hypothetical protein
MKKGRGKRRLRTVKVKEILPAFYTPLPKTGEGQGVRANY